METGVEQFPSVTRTLPKCAQIEMLTQTIVEVQRSETVLWNGCRHVRPNVEAPVCVRSELWVCCFKASSYPTYQYPCRHGHTEYAECCHGNKTCPTWSDSNCPFAPVHWFICQAKQAH